MYEFFLASERCTGSQLTRGKVQEAIRYEDLAFNVDDAFSAAVMRLYGVMSACFGVC